MVAENRVSVAKCAKLLINRPAPAKEATAMATQETTTSYAVCRAAMFHAAAAAFPQSSDVTFAAKSAGRQGNNNV